MIDGPVSFVNIAYQVASGSHPHLEDCKLLLYHIFKMGIFHRVDVFLSLKSEATQFQYPNGGGKTT